MGAFWRRQVPPSSLRLNLHPSESPPSFAWLQQGDHGAAVGQRDRVYSLSRAEKGEQRNNQINVRWPWLGYPVDRTGGGSRVPIRTGFESIDRSLYASSLPRHSFKLPFVPFQRFSYHRSLTSRGLTERIFQHILLPI